VTSDIALDTPVRRDLLQIHLGNHGPVAGEGSLLQADSDTRVGPALDADDREARSRVLFDVARTSTDPSRRTWAHEQIVRLHMDVAQSLSRRYRNRGIPDEDLEQVAYLTLVKVVRSFDLDKGQSFLAFAVPSIRGALKKHFRDRGWAVRPPRRIQELQYSIRQATEELQQSLGRSPRPSEVAARLEVSVDDVIEALAADSCFAPTSLDRPVTPGGEASALTLGDCLGVTEEALEAAEARTMLAPAIRRLGERDQRILWLRFCDQMSQQEIADVIGVTQMQVSRLLARILRDLRVALSPSPEPANRRSA
jgi:RNA polymerase sigma-B factor